MPDKKQDVIVRRLRRSDIARVARLHATMFPTARSTQLGDLFVRRMYRWFLQQQGELALVAIVEGKPVGFITGAIGGYGRRIARAAAPQIAWCLLSQPKLLFNRNTFRAWTSYIQAFRPNFGAPATPPTLDSADQRDTPLIRASVASIAVANEYGGRGIGRTLMEAFEAAARARGANQIGLSVEAGNTAARRLYEKCGLRVLHENEVDAYYVKDLA